MLESVQFLDVGTEEESRTQVSLLGDFPPAHHRRPVARGR